LRERVFVFKDGKITNQVADVRDNTPWLLDEYDLPDGYVIFFE